MIENNVSLDSMVFIEQDILPKHDEFGLSHGLGHVQHVIKGSLKLAKRMGANVNMAYTVTTYHGIGVSGPRAIRHPTGGKIPAADVRLKRWFSPEQIRTVRGAVEGHRVSASRSSRNVYREIMTETDRDLEPKHVFRRIVQLGLENGPGENREEQQRRFLAHLQEKYSSTSYIKLRISNSPNEKHLRTTRSATGNPDKLRRQLDNLYDEETGKQHTC